MIEKLRIRDTCYLVSSVLELISRGISYEDIQQILPGITISDIMYSARIALDLMVRHSALVGTGDIDSARWERIGTVRAWNADESRELSRLRQHGASLDDIAKILCRARDEIESRIQKLGLPE